MVRKHARSARLGLTQLHLLLHVPPVPLVSTNGMWGALRVMSLRQGLTLSQVPHSTPRVQMAPTSPAQVNLLV